MAGEAEDLDALFDSIAQVRAAGSAGAAAAPVADELPCSEPGKGMFEQVGRCTRQLHEAMRQLGYDQSLSQSTTQIADAKGRLEYVAELTEKAANKVLNAIDEGMPEEDALLRQSRQLSASWERLFAGQSDIAEFKQLAADSQAFMSLVAQTAERQKARMMDIMMAQDFQDITGQIIKKIVAITQAHEQELMKILRDHASGFGQPRSEDKVVDLMAGPDVPASAMAQDDVDDLLADLGF